jgi:hypothetical protein
VSYPHLFTTPGLAAFAAEIDTERARQLAKFGNQRHPDGTQHRRARLAAAARGRCQLAANQGRLTWRHILEEEVQEAYAETDTGALRAELVQIAAVCAAWVSDIDRRDATAGDPR